MDEARLREQAREAIKNGKLPTRALIAHGAVLAKGWRALSASGQ